MPWLKNRRGQQLWYEDNGRSGPAVVMVHGWCMSSAVWKYQFEGLGDILRIVAPDLRGHGRSRGITTEIDFDAFANDLTDLFEVLALEKVVLAGWSMGAQVALRSAAQLSARLTGMVLIAATPCFSAMVDFPFGLAAKESSGMQLKIQRNSRRALDGFYSRMFTQAELASRPEVLGLLESIPVPDTESVLGALHALVHADMRGILAGMAIPTLVVNGAQDIICLPQASLYLKEHLPDARQYVFQECRHAPFLSYSHQFNAEIARFVRSVSEENV